MVREWFAALHEFWRTIIMTAYERLMYPEHTSTKSKKKEEE